MTYVYCTYTLYNTQVGDDEHAVIYSGRQGLPPVSAPLPLGQALEGTAYYILWVCINTVYTIRVVYYMYICLRCLYYGVLTVLSHIWLHFYT